MNIKIAERYTKSLFQTSLESGNNKAVLRDMSLIADCIAASEDFEAFLGNPTITWQRQRSIIDRLFKGKVETVTYGLVCLLARKHRLNLLKHILVIYRRLDLDHKNIVKARITSTSVLSKKQIRDITDHLKSRLKKEVEAETDIDPAMLGGIRIREGDTIHDFSVKTQLERFRRQLIKA